MADEAKDVADHLFVDARTVSGQGLHREKVIAAAGSRQVEGWYQVDMNRAGFAGDLKPEKDESHGKEHDSQPLFTGGPRPRGSDGAGTPEFL
ncbi:hypothetical protein [Pseudooceanicola algae]|uniref:hypothetical protein n=1 Tax=Pseudooceanicola algae TaxID=1537215 RepID=UPI0011C3A124|nr:hypothetical protein [Pseudooceanicola algae]